MNKQIYGEGVQQAEWKLGALGFLGICAMAAGMCGALFYGAMLGSM